MSENRLNHMVMILNENIDEGEEFLLYAYPNDRHELKDSIAEKLLRTRDVIATMRGVTVQLAGQEFRVANISDDGEAQIKVKISSVEVAEGLVLALIAPKETHDVLLCRMSSSIVNCLEMCYGPQRTLQDFLDLIGYEAAEEYNQNDVKISTSARTALDPFFKQYFGSFLSGSCETRILEALPNCIPCHVPPLQTKNDDGEDNKDKSVKHAHKRRESREHKRSSQISEMGLRLRVASQTSIQETFWVVGRRK
eukprot:jgi/Bigna1/79322/fgenesh1_pg.61_\